LARRRINREKARRPKRIKKYLEKRQSRAKNDQLTAEKEGETEIARRGAKREEEPEKRVGLSGGQGLNVSRKKGH